MIFRWNFLTRSKRIQPWFQGAGGLIYTTHKFPPDVLVPHGFPGGTSVWNFSPSGGHRYTLVHSPETLRGPGGERGAYLFGLAGRPQSGRERERSDPGRLQLVEVKTEN